MPKALEPHFDDVQAHYDLSDEFFQLFLDPSRTYSCAYFEREDMTLEEAQLAKIDLALGKLGLEPGMTLLDVGCGWGSTMLRAVQRHDVNVVGLTLSRNQRDYVAERLAADPSPRSKQVLLQGWEQFYEPVDRVVSIGAFEHFGPDRYDAFFQQMYKALPSGGVLLLHTITATTAKDAAANGIPLTFELARFVKFILTEIFPGGRLPSTQLVTDHAMAGGFDVQRVQSLRPHYARTLDLWAQALEAHRDDAVTLQSEEVYDRYMRYLTGCAKLFRNRTTDVCQFTLKKI